MDDLELRNDILAELEFEPGIDAAHIGAAVEDGIVTLTGHVADYAGIMAVERAVRRVRGVKGVAQEIEVRYPSAKGTGDDEIAERAARILAWQTGLPEGEIQVKVEDGWVTLAGEVDSRFQRGAVGEAIGQLAGIRGVTNLLTIRPRPLTRATKRLIEDAMRRYLGADAGHIRIKLQDGAVTLEGHVRSIHERDMAENAAWSAPGVAHVENLVPIV
jgi:osmotically-inducible protein OsmY